jgi:subtilisin-like proprotein convertase family protein
MKTLKLKALAVAVTPLLSVAVAQGQYVTNSTSTSVNVAIPDGSPIGLVSTSDLSGLPGVISSVAVNLDITGGFNGDFYAYLVGPSGEFTVLLNRVGVTTGNAFGYGDSGLNITFADGNPNIHTYQLDSPTYNGQGQLTGTWAPDGRDIDPQSAPSAFDTAPTSSDLSSLNGDTANGAWTLFVADLSSGGQGTLVSWGLTVVTVPEPQTWALVGGGLGLLMALNLRRKL